MKIYVVSCDSGRFDRMSKSIQNTNISLEFVKSYVTTDEIVSIRGQTCLDRKMSEPRLIAMTLGHMKAMQCIIDSNEEIGIIAEDDVRFHKDFEILINQYKDYMLNSETDVLSLGFVNFPRGNPILFNNIKILENVQLGNPWGTQCFMITRNFAMRFLNIFKEDDLSIPYSNCFSPDWVIFDPILGTKRSTLMSPIAVESPDEQSIGVIGSNKPNLFIILNKNDFML
jgi:GR25 family glycosyltransferase involved in LPS biosynthesis